MKRLTLFTDRFPFLKGEPYLITEIGYLAKEFTSVHIIPLYGESQESITFLPDNVTCEKPLFTNIKDKKKLLINGVFNLSKIDLFRQDFFENKVYKSKKKMYDFITCLLLTRAILSHDTVKSQVKNASTTDVFYFYWGTRSSWIIPFISKCKARKILRLHRSDLYEYLYNDYIPLRKKQYAAAEMAFFISKNGIDYANSTYPDFSNKYFLSRLGVEDKGTSNASNDGIFRIASCSHVVPVKRLDIVVNALSYITGSVEWLHFGDGESLYLIKEKSKGLSNNIKCNFKGYTPNEDVLLYYKNNPIDLFINVSSSEGVPVSIMEALSMGIPVMATDVGGTSEIVDTTVGELLNAEISSQELAGKITKFILNKDKEQYRNNARNRWSQLCNAKVEYATFAKLISR